MLYGGVPGVVNAVSSNGWAANIYWFQTPLEGPKVLQHESVVVSEETINGNVMLCGCL